jgi:hypothetical protein
MRNAIAPSRNVRKSGTFVPLTVGGPLLSMVHRRNIAPRPLFCPPDLDTL